MFKKVGLGLAALGVFLFGMYFRFIRPWQLRRGATDEEVYRNNRTQRALTERASSSQKQDCRKVKLH